MTELAAYLQDWHPEPVTDVDELAAGPVAALSGLLDLPEPVAVHGDALPPMWHWLHFPHWPAQRDLGADGHPLAGHFLPPIPERTRMFAGGRLSVTRPLTLGEPTERRRELGDVTVKQGSSGELAFVTVRSEISQRGQCCVVEEQDLVYRSGAAPRDNVVLAGTDDAPVSDDAWQLAVLPDETLLFRFSALTANAHRIHYDQPYATTVEGYPALVVHGPLLVLLMLELARREAPERNVASVRYRLRSPAFVGERLLAHGRPDGSGGAELGIATGRESSHATMRLEFAPGPTTLRRG